MVWLCVRFRDFSPLLPLSWRDYIYLAVFDIENGKIEQQKGLVLEDCRFFLERISACLTGDAQMNFLPSKVAEMGRKWEERHRGTAPAK